MSPERVLGEEREPVEAGGGTRPKGPKGPKAFQRTKTSTRRYRLLQKAKATFMRKTTCKWVHIHAFLWHGAKGIPERALVGDVLALE
eukprot:g18565.t1